MMRAILVFLAALTLWAPIHADAAGARFKLRVLNRGDTTTTDIIPGGLVPGSGGVTNAAWTTTAMIPSSFGNPSAYGWARMPMTSFTTPLFATNPTTLSALAFHLPSDEEYDAGIKSNINYVAVSCDGGPWSIRDRMEFNADTGTTEYFWRIVADPSVWADGLHECRMVAVPLTGQARILQGDHTAGGGSLARSALFYTNFGGSFTPLIRYVERSGADTTNCGQVQGVTPCLTASYALTRMAAVRSDLGGSIVCLGLAPENNPHSWGAPSGNLTRAAADQYITVSSCGNPRAGVYVRSSDNEGSTSGLRARKIRAHEITMIGEPFYGGSTGTGVQEATGWFDHVTFKGKGALTPGFVLGSDWDGGVYITDSQAEEIGNFSPGDLIRNTTINQVGGDSLSGGRLIVNVSVTNANDRTYATGTSSAGSNVVTNVSNFSRLLVTAPIEFCGRSGTDYVSITAMDPGAQTITFDKTCLTALTDSTIFSAKHSDVVQYGAAVFSNIIITGLYTDYIYGAGFFTDRAGTQVNDIAIVDSLWNNTSEPNGFSLAQFNRPMTNALFLNSTWIGSRVYASSDTFTATDFSWIDNVCSNVRAMPAGVYQRGSPTCVP